jgi:small subunit ribosomal protein S20
MAQEKDAKVKKKVKRPTALKRDLQSEKKRVNNRVFKARVQTAIRALSSSMAKKDGTSSEHLNAVYSLMDKGVKTGALKSNTVNRKKARLAAKLASV